MIFSKRTWMAKPMESRLYYICRTTDRIKDVPYTDERANSVSPLFYTSHREALIDLKERIAERVQYGVCQIMQIERQLANDTQVQKPY